MMNTLAVWPQANTTSDEVMMRKRSRQPRVAVVRHDRFPGDPHLRWNVDALREAGLAVNRICDMDLYRNPARRASLAAMGHSAYREKVSWDRTQHNYLAVYGVHPTQIC
ncbi:MAG TPA: hypothetical protein VKF37_12595 [Chloroflexota bacterium]|nr:hypothetical protein [Chloroflexota bacterium]